MIGHIPRELKAVKKWLVWKHEKDENGGRLLKVPYNARTGRKAKTNDPKTWSTFKEAAEAYEKSNGIYAGLGFVFTSGGNFTGIDLDECLADGKPSKEALQILQMVNSYAEISPSGNGLHIIVKGKLEGGARSATCKCKRGMKQIEIYSAGRFFTMTGSMLEGYEKIRDAGAGFFRLVDRMSGSRQINETPEEESVARFNDSIFLKNELLPVIPCAEVSYNEWLKIGMVCKLAGLSCEDWDEWSATDDYRRMSALKHFADGHGVSLVVVHHLRKGGLDGDPFNRISGTSGLFGAADASIVMQREKRDDVLTQFHITGRDVAPEDYAIEFDKTSFRWNLKGELDAIRYEDDPIVQTVKHLLENKEEWSGTASELLAACEEFTGKPLSYDVGQFGKMIRGVAPDMYAHDDILYNPPGKYGGKKGRQHTFSKEETIF